MADDSKPDKWRLIRGTNLKTEDRHCLLTLFFFQGDNAAAFCKQETLADEIGVHPRSVRRSLQRLNDAGIIASEWQILNGVPMRTYAINFEALKTVQRGNGRTPASYPDTCNGRTPASATVGHQRPKPQDTSVLQEDPLKIQGRSKSERTRKTKFQKPTADDVRQYATERNVPNFDAEYFIDFYDSNGWRVGRNSMKDWRATVRRWLKTGGTQNNGKPAGNAEALQAWQKIIQVAKDHHGDARGFENAIGTTSAGILKSLRLTRQKIDQANNFERREQEREFIQAFSRQGAAA